MSTSSISQKKIMHKSKVILHGGIGNQLFQWSFGHYLNLSGRQIDYLFMGKDYVIEHTRNSLSTLLTDCQHGNFQFEDVSRNQVSKIFKDPSSRFNPFSKFSSYLIDSRDEPFSCHESFSRNYLGYFQNSEMVSKVRAEVYGHLVSDLYRDTPNAIEETLNGQEIVHIRQGDTKTLQNIQRVGILSRHYYISLPPKRAERRYVLTDDPDEARRMFKGIDIDGIFGPEQVNVLSALRIMGNASTLYTANSTLSWWGGFLAIHRQGSVYIPHRFFKNVKPEPHNAFHFPGFKILPSNFVESAQHE